MKVAFGSSKEKEAELALQEAYRKSLKVLGATRADFCLVIYSYDHAMDLAALAGALKRTFRDTPNAGVSSWGAWGGREAFGGETGILVASFKDFAQGIQLFKVHSLREKAELWATELCRHIQDQKDLDGRRLDTLLLLADSLNFVPADGMAHLERTLDGLQACGFGASYTVPQVSVVCNGEVFMNSLIGIGLYGVQPWLGLAQNVLTELRPIDINRMSENLIIEIDQKPAFYRLCEHLMEVEDLPMMSPDNFRKHMGEMFILEVPKHQPTRMRTCGQHHKVVSLLGSEMTTGMVAVAHELDFTQEHYLGQKKSRYAEADIHKVLEQLKIRVPNPSFLFVMSGLARFRDQDRTADDLALVRAAFDDVPLMGVTTHGEYLGGANQFSSIIAAFP